MISKLKLQEYAQYYLKKGRSALEVPRFWVVDLQLSHKHKNNIFGFCHCYSRKKFTIEIFRNRHFTELEVACTVLHELLHAKAYHLRLNPDKEEKYIGSVEKLIKRLLLNKIKLYDTKTKK